jgi:hypothetical protein
VFRLCARLRRLGRDVHGLGMLLRAGAEGVQPGWACGRAGPARTRLGPDACAQKNKNTRKTRSTELTKKPVDGFSAGLVEDSLFEWAITVMGPPDTY